jgi:hypothetical protein
MILRRFIGKKNEKQNKERELVPIYGWRSSRRLGLRSYVAVYRVKNVRGGTANEIGLRLGERTRKKIKRYILVESPSLLFEKTYTELSRTWDEILPSYSPLKLATHFFEVGVQTKNNPRSAYFRIALDLRPPFSGRDSDYCAIQIGQFLAYFLRQQTQFTGAALDEQKIWLLHCISAKWKALR